MTRDNGYDDKKDVPTKRQDQDFDTPFSMPSDAKQRLPIDHPSKDEPGDSHERYDEGEDDAALDNKPGGEPGAGPRPKKMF